MFVKTPCPQCGRLLTYPVTFVGRETACPTCRATVIVEPQEPPPVLAKATPPLRATADTAAGNRPVTLPLTSAASTAVAEPAPGPADAEASAEAFGTAPRVHVIDEDDGMDLGAPTVGAMPLPTAAEPTDAPRVQAVGFELWCLDQSILGGIGLIVVAIVWFAIGWYCGYVYFYPPILALLGIAAIVRGLLSDGPL